MPRKRRPPTCTVRVRTIDRERLKELAKRNGLGMPQLITRILGKAK